MWNLSRSERQPFIKDDWLDWCNDVLWAVGKKTSTAVQSFWFVLWRWKNICFLSKDANALSNWIMKISGWMMFSLIGKHMMIISVQIHTGMKRPFLIVQKDWNDMNCGRSILSNGSQNIITSILPIVFDEGLALWTWKIPRRKQKLYPIKGWFWPLCVGRFDLLVLFSLLKACSISNESLVRSLSWWFPTATL